jgi:hypothetical protein
MNQALYANMNNKRKMKKKKETSYCVPSICMITMCQIKIENKYSTIS